MEKYSRFLWSIATSVARCTPLLELCAQNRNLEGVTEDLKDWVISILGGLVLHVQFC